MIKNVIIVILIVISAGLAIYANKINTEANVREQEALNYKYIVDMQTQENFELREQLVSCRDSLTYQNID